MSSEAGEGVEEPNEAEAVTSEEAPEVAPAPESPEWIELPDGEELNEEQAGETMKVTPSKVILVAGEDDTGKTSLLCGVYERFLSGEFAGHLFCGSRTLRAFERRSFLQRAESERPEPDMQRTRLPAGQLALLHLELKSKSSPERTALLATDLAGEAFRLIRNDPKECERYPVLGRVDCVTVLLDAERLISDERHGHVNSSRTTLRSMLQSEKLRAGVPIILALSKWDAVTAAAEPQAREDALAVLAPARGNPTEIVKIAAAPIASGAVKAGYGLQGLLRTWLGAEPPAGEVPQGNAVDLEPSSAFDLYRGEGT
jgi:Double-GTPase 2